MKNPQHPALITGAVAAGAALLSLTAGVVLGHAALSASPQASATGTAQNVTEPLTGTELPAAQPPTIKTFSSIPGKNETLALPIVDRTTPATTDSISMLREGWPGTVTVAPPDLDNFHLSGAVAFRGQAGAFLHHGRVTDTGSLGDAYWLNMSTPTPQLASNEITLYK